MHERRFACVYLAHANFCTFYCGHVGLEILAFPSNQFGAQEPGSNEQIKEFACSRYKATFPLFDKVSV